MDLKERTREPSGTDSPGTGTGASHVASPRTTPASRGAFVPRAGRGPTVCEPGVIVSSILVALLTYFDKYNYKTTTTTTKTVILSSNFDDTLSDWEVAPPIKRSPPPGDMVHVRASMHTYIWRNTQYHVSVNGVVYKWSNQNGCWVYTNWNLGQLLWVE